MFLFLSKYLHEDGFISSSNVYIIMVVLFLFQCLPDGVLFFLNGHMMVVLFKCFILNVLFMWYVCSSSILSRKSLNLLVGQLMSCPNSWSCRCWFLVKLCLRAFSNCSTG